MTTSAAAVARFRRVAGIDQDDRKPYILGFILHELAQLIEAPGMVLCPLRLADLRAVPYPRQVFQGKGFGLRPGRLNQLFADHVVDRPHVSPLVSREPLQEPSGSPCAFGLERPTDFEVVGTERLNRIAFVSGAQGIDGNPSAAKIDAQDAHGPLASGSRGCDLDVQEIGPIAAFDQRRTGGILSRETGFLMVPQGHLKACSAYGRLASRPYQRQATGPILLPKAENALIVVNRGGRKRRVGFLFDLQRGTDTGNSPNGEVGRQTEACPDIAVTRLLHLHLVGGMDLACHVRNVVAGLGKGVQCRIKRRALWWCWGQFAGHRAYSLHEESIHIFHSHTNLWLKPGKAFSPLPLKRRGIHGLKPNFGEGIAQFLAELIDLGFEHRLQQLYQRFEHGEMSLGYFAQALGLGIRDLYAALEQRGLPTANIGGRPRAIPDTDEETGTAHFP